MLSSYVKVNGNFALQTTAESQKFLKPQVQNEIKQNTAIKNS